MPRSAVARPSSPARCAPSQVTTHAQLTGPFRCGVYAPSRYWPLGVWYGVAHLYNRNTLWSPVRYSFRMSHSQPRLNRPTDARIPSCPMVVVVTRLNQIGLHSSTAVWSSTPRSRYFTTRRYSTLLGVFLRLARDGGDVTSTGRARCTHVVDRPG